MNSTVRLDSMTTAVTKNFITFAFGFTINCINGALVYIFFKNQVFQRDPRYVLYIHLVFNDMIMLTGAVALHIITYTTILHLAPCSFVLLILLTTNKNTPLNLAAMAVERYIAICRPLHHIHICTLQRVYSLIALIWVCSFIPAFSDVVIILATQPLSVFSRKVLLFTFVFLTLIVTYLRVFCAARSVSGSDRVSASNARNTILLHGVQLFICMLSFVVPPLNSMLVTVWPQERTSIFFATFLVFSVLPRLLSPLIYGIRDKKFSNHIRQQLCCTCCRSGGKKSLC